MLLLPDIPSKIALIKLNDTNDNNSELTYQASLKALPSFLLKAGKKPYKVKVKCLQKCQISPRH